MAKARSSLAAFVSNVGAKLFPLLSRWEEEGVLKGFARFAKIYILGFILGLLGWLSAQETRGYATCYDPVVIEPVIITEAAITPNPTNGADSVTVRATARVYDSKLEGNIISGADARIGGDTVIVPLRAVDGKFSDTLETVEGRLCVTGLGPETTRVYITFYTPQAGINVEGLQLVISEPDSTEKD